MDCYIYAVGSDLTDKANKRKLGLTIHPEHRMRQYDTGDCPGEGLKKKYQALYLTKAKSSKELRSIEQSLHTHFQKHRLKEGDRITEWFQVNLDDVVKYLSSHPQIVRRLSNEEIQAIHEKASKPRSKDEKEAEREEKQLMDEQEEALHDLNESTLLERFLQVFVPGGALRSNQQELWNMFEQICKSSTGERYCGVVQWPTASGKTLGELLLIVLANEYAKLNGRIFRCLLVAPKNDIFNTIISHIRKLSEFGITVCEGHNGQMSTVNIPRTCPIVVTATHAALTNEELMLKLPNMEMVHYDEVHRIGGEVFFELLKDRMDVWETRFLTGTSATPKTACPTQHEKLKELFGDPYRILHKVSIDEAVEKGWIANPRFQVKIVSKGQAREAIIEQFVQSIVDAIEQKKQYNWKGGKVIAYLPMRAEVCDAVILAHRLFPPNWKVFTAVEDAEGLEDSEFITEPADGRPRVLFACERYREGSDIHGLEMTSVLMGNTIASNILLQIIGRSLRADYKEKEGWCSLFRPSEEGTTEEEVLEKILFEIMETIGRNDVVLEKKDIQRIVKTFMGEITMSTRTFSLEETVDRIQALYERKTFERGIQREKYQTVRFMNSELGLTSRYEYLESRSKRRVFIEDPCLYFRDVWQNWYHFLGVDTSHFPQTKAEFQRVCKDRQIQSWEQYKQKKYRDLPENPSEFYSDWSNWDREFGIEEEIVW